MGEELSADDVKLTNIRNGNTESKSEETGSYNAGSYSNDGTRRLSSKRVEFDVEITVAPSVIGAMMKKVTTMKSNPAALQKTFTTELSNRGQSTPPGFSAMILTISTPTKVTVAPTPS